MLIQQAWDPICWTVSGLRLVPGSLGRPWEQRGLTLARRSALPSYVHCVSDLVSRRRASLATHNIVSCRFQVFALFAGIPPN